MKSNPLNSKTLVHYIDLDGIDEWNLHKNRFFNHDLSKEPETLEFLCNHFALATISEKRQDHRIDEASASLHESSEVMLMEFAASIEKAWKDDQFTEIVIQNFQYLLKTLSSNTNPDYKAAEDKILEEIRAFSVWNDVLGSEL